MSARAVASLALYEARRQLWTPAAPLIALFLAGYNIAYSSQGDAAAEFGAAGVAANANYVVYLYSVGSCFWLLFLLVHVASAPVTRDVGSRFAELTLSMPVSFRTILTGKMLGATAVGLVIACAIPLSWLATSWLLPEDRVGPTPWRAMWHVYAVFIAPTVIAQVALYFSLAARFGRAAPAYAAAFLWLVVWMIGVAVLFEGGVNRLLAQWIDPIGWVTVLAPLEFWTSDERVEGTLVLGREILVNRALVLALGLGALAHTLATAKAERWLGAGGRRRRAGAPKAELGEKSTPRFAPVVTSFGLLAQTRLLATCSRIWLTWQLRTAGARILLLFLLLSMIGGGWAHVLHGSNGMKWPWTGFALPRMFEIVFLPASLYLCFAAGQMVFRERNDRFAEVFDASPWPRWVLAAPRIAAHIGLATVFSMVLAVGTLAVQLLFAPTTFDPLGAIGLSLVLAWPAFVELGAMAFLVYVLVRREWFAHALAFFVIFVLIVNSEVGLLGHPLLQYGIPLPVDISPLTDWRSWMRPALGIGLVHLSVAALLYLSALLLWPRGFAPTWRAHVASAAAEAPRFVLGALAAVAALGVLSAVEVTNALSLAGQGNSHREDLAQSAAYERKFRESASSLDLVSLELELELHPPERRIDVQYRAWLQNSTAAPLGRVDVDLPAGFEVLSVSLDGRAPAAWEPDVDLQHGVVRTDAPIAPRSQVELRISGRMRRGALSMSPALIPIDRGGAWLTSASVTPRIGYLRERELDSPHERARHGLGARVPLSSSSLATAYGAGSTRARYKVRVSAPPEYALIVPEATSVRTGTAQISGEGPVHFAVVAVDRATTTHLTQPGTTRIHVVADRERAAHSGGMLDRGASALAHLESRFGDSLIEDLWIVHCPRGTVSPELYGNLLMLPDEAAWDYAPDDPNFDEPLFQISFALSQHWFVGMLRPREVPGYAALRHGLPLAAGLHSLSELRSPLVASNHHDVLEQSALQDIAAASAALRAPNLAETPAEGRIAGLALHGLRQYHGASAFDALVREQLGMDAPSMSTLVAALERRIPGSRSMLETITAVDARIVQTTYSPSGRVLAETSISAFAFAGGRWQPLDHPPLPVELAVRSSAEEETVVSTTALGGKQLLKVATDASSLELDPKRVFLDRNRHDNRAPLRSNAVRLTRAADRGEHQGTLVRE